MLPREARLREILCSRRGADCDWHAVAKSGVGLRDLVPEGVRDLIGKERSDLCRSVVVPSRIVTRRRERSDSLLQLVLGDVVPVCRGDDHKARRHGESGARQLTQVGGLAAGLINVAAAQLVELFDEDHELSPQNLTPVALARLAGRCVCKPASENCGNHPRPTYGILVAITVRVATLLSSGSPAM